MSLEQSIAYAALSAAFQVTPILGRQQMEGGAVPAKPAPAYAPSKDYFKDVALFSSPLGPPSSYKKQGDIIRTAHSSLASLYVIPTQARDSYLSVAAPSNALRGYSATLFGLPPAIYSSPDSRYS